MHSFLDYIHDLYRTYYNSDESFEKLQLRLEIEPIVLTGEQILESGIADYSEFDDGKKYTNEEIETLEKELDETKKARDNLIQESEKYEKRLVETEKLSIRKIARVGKLLQGKNGSFVDELRDALR